MYTVRIEQFEGPLDVLLEMIEDRQLDITRLSLAKVTDQFVSYVENTENISLEYLADFLTVASRLLLIKSRALLPVLEVSDEEEEEMVDLEWQLKEYKRCKELAEHIRELFDSPQRLFRREAYLKSNLLHIPFPKRTYSFQGETMLMFIEQLIERMPDPKALKKKIIRKVISVKEKIAYLKKRIEKNTTQTFSSFLGLQPNRDDVAVSFLAVLELERAHMIEAQQEENFGEIVLKKR